MNANAISQKKKTKIVNAWRTSKLNSIPAIALRFDISVHVANKIINDYLSTKTLK